MRPLAARAVTPTARPPSTMIRSARAWVNSSAPARSASGTYDTLVERLASVGQPKQHTPWPSQSGALRLSGAWR